MTLTLRNRETPDPRTRAAASAAAVVTGGEVRCQHAALCYRRNRGKIEVLLITSRDTRRWVLPKGWPMPGLTGAAAAAREAWEEAGVEGEIAPDSIGTFGYLKWMPRSAPIPCICAVYPLQVTALAAHYPERNQRRRKWFTLRKAAARVAEPELRLLLRAAQGLLG